VLRLLEQPQGYGESSIGPYLRQLAIIEVIDNGVGVPPALRERIFESFYSTKPDGKGSGLGLAICRNIVARHGGRIELHSTVGQGTTFRVLLPIDDLSAPLVVAASTPAATMTQRILVVDDDAAVREVLAQIFQRAGHHVTTATNDEEALAHFAPNRYDLLFTDLSSPAMGGGVLLRQIHACDPHVVTVVLTGWGQVEEIQDGAFGVAAVVSKPFDAAQILDLVSKLTRSDAV
jgi:CheY-like chemotaxis protein